MYGLQETFKKPIFFLSLPSSVPDGAFAARTVCERGEVAVRDDRCLFFGRHTCIGIFMLYIFKVEIRSRESRIKNQELKLEFVDKAMSGKLVM